MKKNIEIKKIGVEEIINLFREEDGIELSKAEAEHIVQFMIFLIKLTIKNWSNNV
ncbi:MULTISPECIES: hypothetical protein [Weeksellaceae]|uniref:hypothetical protein n=1 Tax=Weeksellaceae TaxID=2762318 RepID=UPI000B20BAB6|nr:hypothetical protein [Chryseobacterium indologenes]